jgi:hypothetical protein
MKLEDHPLGNTPKDDFILPSTNYQENLKQTVELRIYPVNYLSKVFLAFSKV